MSALRFRCSPLACRGGATHGEQRQRSASGIDHKKGKNFASMISIGYMGGSVHSYEQGSVHSGEHDGGFFALREKYLRPYGGNRFTFEQGPAHV